MERYFIVIFIYYTVNVLKFRTLVACPKGLDKKCRPRSDCFWRSSLIRVFPVCYSDKQLVNSSSENQDLFENRKRKVFKFLDHLPYSKTCVKRPLSKWPKIGFQDQLLLNAGQKYCRMLQGEHSAILLTFIKLPFVMKIFVFSIFEWPFYTGFTIIVSLFSLGAFSDDGPSCFLTASLSPTICQQDDSWLTSDEFYTCYFCAHVYKGKFISVVWSSVVECLTRDRGVVGSSLTSLIALFP